MTYVATLIAVADDCRATVAVEPPVRGARPTVARVQYELLAVAPFEHTQEDVLFRSWLARRDDQPRSGAEIAELRDAFFAKPQACLRSSPLAKTYGWGFVFDDRGRVALCAVESDEYRRYLTSGEVTVVKALRSTRA